MPAPRPAPRPATDSPPPQPALWGREWLRAPLRVGAVLPSGAALARAMTAGLGPDTGPVLELGPGTGAFTRALIDRGIPPDRITAVETSAAFATALARRFPQVRVIHGDAARLRRMAQVAPGGAGAVICGLPLLSIPPGGLLRILDGAMAALRPGGVFRLFTYGHRCPVPPAVLDRLGLVARHEALVALNLPPASVYLLERAGAHGPPGRGARGGTRTRTP